MKRRIKLRILSYDHVGIRVSDAKRARDFYRKLGFEIDPDFSNDRVAEMITPDGARINLIFNGIAQPNGHNILLDEPVKLPGYTHGAFIVESLQDIVDWAAKEGVSITEGPVNWGRRLTCFIRDPDGNVIEFNELFTAATDQSDLKDLEPILHEYSASGNCYKVRLTAAHLGIQLKHQEYDIFQGETRTPQFIDRVDAGGRIPVLQVGDRYLPESNAICFYLASGSPLIPKGRFELADMLRWMFFEQYNHEPNIASIYVWRKLGPDRLTDSQRTLIPEKLKKGHDALRRLETHLTGKDFLIDHFSLADIILYAYSHVAEEAGFDLADYSNVRAWLERVASQSRHIRHVELNLPVDRRQGENI